MGVQEGNYSINTRVTLNGFLGVLVKVLKIYTYHFITISIDILEL